MEMSDWEADYKQGLPAYERLEEEALFALGHAVRKEGIKLHSLTGRVKTIESLREKAERKAYTRPLEQTPDLVGVRVVVLFMSDLARVDEIVNDEFEIRGTEDKVEGDVDLSTFGYTSRHFDVRIPPTHQGPRYNEIRDINCEVQVRTLLMDAWANVSHVLAYKGESSIPTELRRDFHALSGLFFVADKHFELFFGQTIEMREQAEQQLAEAPGNVDLNLDTLSAFLKQRFPDRSHGDRPIVAELADELLRFGYQKIGTVEEMLDRSLDAFEKHEKKRPPFAEEGRRFSDVGVVRVSLCKVDPMYEKYLKSNAVEVPDSSEEDSLEASE